jgi:hypothetical protein
MIDPVPGQTTQTAEPIPGQTSLEAAVESLDRLAGFLGWSLPVLGILKGLQTLFSLAGMVDLGVQGVMAVFLMAVSSFATFAIVGVGLKLLIRAFARWLSVWHARGPLVATDLAQPILSRESEPSFSSVQAAVAPTPEIGAETAHTEPARRQEDDAAIPTPTRSRADQDFDAVMSLVHQGDFGGAEDRLAELADRWPGHERLKSVKWNIETTREMIRGNKLAQLHSAKEVNDPDRVLELHETVVTLLDHEAKTALEADLSRWFLRLIHQRLRSGKIEAEVVSLAGRISDVFGHTHEGASLRASMPTLRRSVGLCPRCGQPYKGLADACPACMARAKPKPPMPEPSSTVPPEPATEELNEDEPSSSAEDLEAQDPFIRS